MIRISSLSMAAPAEFVPGTLVLSYGHRHAKARGPSVGIRVGSTDKVFAVTDWYDGRLQAGRVFEPGDFLCGVSPEKYELQLMHDLEATSVEWTSDHDGAGQLGFNSKGVRILSSIGDTYQRRAVVIDPATWEVETSFDADWTLPGASVRLVDRELKAVAHILSWSKGAGASTSA